MFKRSLLVLATLAFAVSCSTPTTMPTPSRDVAQDHRWDDRDRRPGFEFGEYTSQTIESRDSRGFIDLSETFGGYRGLMGKNLKGLLIEAASMERRDPRDRMAEIAVTYDRMPIERFAVTNMRGRQFFYLDLNRRLEDNFRKLNLEYNPRTTRVVNLTLLTNDGFDRPWPGPGPGPIPQPPKRDEFGVLYTNTASYKYFFEKDFSQMEADFKAKNKCTADGNAMFCKQVKAEALIPGEEEFVCRVDNSATYLSYGGNAVGRLEAEANAFANCQKNGNQMFCKLVTCSTGVITQRNMVSRCFNNNNATGKTFLGRGRNEVEAALKAKEACQVEGNAMFCKAGQCQSEPDTTPGPGPGANPWPKGNR